MWFSRTGLCFVPWQHCLSSCGSDDLLLAWWTWIISETTSSRSIQTLLNFFLVKMQSYISSHSFENLLAGLILTVKLLKGKRKRNGNAWTNFLDNNQYWWENNNINNSMIFIPGAVYCPRSSEPNLCFSSHPSECTPSCFPPMSPQTGNKQTI